MALATTSKGASSINQYFTKKKSLAGEMASMGWRLEDEESVSYILIGIDLDFNLVVSFIATRVELISIGELYTQLVNFEQRMEMHGGGSQFSTNVVARGGHGGGNNSRGRGGFG